MRVVCHSKSKHLAGDLDTITPRDLAKRVGELTGAFAVIPPLTPESRHVVVEYAITNNVVIFVLFRDLEGLNLARMLFGEFVRLSEPTYETTSVTSPSPAMQQYMSKRKVDRIIQYMLPDPQVDMSDLGYSDGDDPFFANDEGGDKDSATESRGAADHDLPKITPLATAGASENLCAASVSIGAGIAVLAPLGGGLDREDAGLLEQVAHRLMKQPDKVCLFLSWADPNHPTISVDDSEPIDIPPQSAAVLTSLYVGGGKSTTTDIWAAIVDITSVAWSARRELSTDDARAVDNRIQKANAFFKERVRPGVPFNLVASPGGRSGAREVDGRVSLVVTDIPRGPTQ